MYIVYFNCVIDNKAYFLLNINQDIFLKHKHKHRLDIDKYDQLRNKLLMN